MNRIKSNLLVAMDRAGVLCVALPLYEGFDWTVNRIYVPEGKSLLLRYKGPLFFTWGNKYAAPGHFAQEGEIGMKEEMPGPGRHFYCPIWWERTLVDDVVVQPGELAIVTSKLGDDLPSGQFLVDGDLGETKSKGILRRTFGPGRYRINPYGYESSIVKTEQVDAGGGQIKYSGWVHINPGYVGVVTYLTDNRRPWPKSRHPERYLAAGLVSDQSPRNADRHGLHRLQCRGNLHRKEEGRAGKDRLRRERRRAAGCPTPASAFPRATVSKSTWISAPSGA